MSSGRYQVRASPPLSTSGELKKSVNSLSKSLIGLQRFMAIFHSPTENWSGELLQCRKYHPCGLAKRAYTCLDFGVFSQEEQGMARAKQLTLWVADQPGVLGEIASALGEKKTNIVAVMGATEGGRGAVRMVVDKPATARKVFASRGWQVTEEEVLAVTLSDSPGALGRVATKLGRAGVNIQYVYVGSAGSARKLNAYLGVSDLKAALKAAR